MQQAYRTRLEIVFASSAPKAVILRRGPKHHFHLIEWNLDDDTFRHGQWMKGIVRLCDITPSGDKLLYWAAQYHVAPGENDRRFKRAPDDEADDVRKAYEPLVRAADVTKFLKRHPKRKLPRYMRGAADARRAAQRRPPRQNQGVWTAISRPPWFSALAIWPGFGQWTGGGYFRSDNEVVLFETEDGLTPVANVRPPSTFRIAAFNRNDPGFNIDMQRRMAAYDAVRDRLEAVHGAVADGGRRFVDRLEPLAGGDLVMAVDGSVYRLSDWQSIAPDEALGRATRIADFNGMSFEMKPAPSAAMSWR